ncbi:MAG: adenosylhomocysteinase, partial [Nitrospiraceae bacterium]
MISGGQVSESVPLLLATTGDGDRGDLVDYDVKDIKLAAQGKLKIEWAEATMPVLRLIKKRFKRQRPLLGT